MGTKLNNAVKLGLGLAIVVGVSGCASAGTSSHATFDPATGSLAPCPSSPNCVSTAASDAGHAIAPYAFTGSATDAKARILAIVNDMPRTSVVTDDDNYLHVEFRSRLFRFVDDVEFFFDEADSLVRFRSASRTGYGDGGVNRKRMEEIRAQFEHSSP